MTDDETIPAFVRAAERTSDPVQIGIDPGAEGAIAALCGRLNLVFDIPTLQTAVRRKRRLKKGELLGDRTKTVQGSTSVYNYARIAQLFRLFRPIKARISVMLEEGQVQVRGKGANAYTGFKVGMGYGLWQLYFASRGWPLETIDPGTWKRAMGLRSEDKEFSRAQALALFPSAPLGRKKDHNRAEALLLAVYALRLRGAAA